MIRTEIGDVTVKGSQELRADERALAAERAGLGEGVANRPAAHARALAVPGAHIFDPSGRGSQFKQWVVVPLEQADEWEPLAAEAVVQDHSHPG